jgi:hypothetical protein
VIQGCALRSCDPEQGTEDFEIGTSGTMVWYKTSSLLLYHRIRPLRLKDLKSRSIKGVTPHLKQEERKRERKESTI